MRTTRRSSVRPSSVPGTSTGTGTDAAGNFSLKVDAGTQSVEISFIGYVTETREIKGGSH